MASKTQATLAVGVMLAVLIVLDALPSWATKPTSGRVRLEYAEPPTPDAPWKFRIWALNYRDFENGKLILAGLPPQGSKTAVDVVLWEGSRAAHDTIFAEYTASPPPPGNYLVYARLNPSPEKGGYPEHSSDALYITVRENRVLTDRGSWDGNYYQELLEDLEARGLKDATEEELWQKAPDLAARLRDRSSTMIPAPRPSDSSPRAVQPPGLQDSAVSPQAEPPASPGYQPEDIPAPPQTRELSEWERRVAENRANRPVKPPRWRPERSIKDSTRTHEKKDSLLDTETYKRLKPEYDSLIEQMGAPQSARPVIRDTTDSDNNEPDR